MKLQELFAEPTTARAIQENKTQGEDWVFELNGMAVADSRKVAKVFGKAHRHVLEAIDNLINGIYPIVEEAQNDWAEFSVQLKDLKITDLFIEGSYKDRSGKSNKLYYLTKQGFDLAVFSFTGQKALIYKLLFIKRYEAMEAFIKERLSKPQTLDATAMATIMAQAMTAVLPDLTHAVTDAVAGAIPAILKAAWESPPQAATPPQRVADARLATLPDTLTVKQVREYLSIGFDRSYNLFHSADFPAYTIGRNLFVSKVEFIQWLSTTSKHGIFIG